MVSKYTTRYSDYSVQFLNSLRPRTNFQFMKYSTKCNEMSDIKTFIFFDIESTGLPYLENYKTRITEFSMVAVDANHIRLGVFPRVQNKLSFCFNPRRLISEGAEKMTHLSNTLLENQLTFSDNTVDLINGFLSHNPQPVCLVAHNGDKFDFPLLQKEIMNTKSSLIHNVHCIDSLQTFRAIHESKESSVYPFNVIRNKITDEFQSIPSSCSSPKIIQKAMDVVDCVPIELKDDFDGILFQAVTQFEEQVAVKVLEYQKKNEITPIKQVVGSGVSSNNAKKLKFTKRSLNDSVSFKLCDIYKRLTKKEPVDSHHAEGDVLTLITCAAVLGDEFVNWANKNKKNFCDVPPLKPVVTLPHKK